MKPKSPPLDKTLVTEFSTDLADIHLRQRQIRNSIAVRVPVTTIMSVGDFNLLGSQQLVLEDIQVSVQIHGYESFFIDVVNGFTSGTFLCSGLFITFGSFDRIVVRKNVTDTRISYLCA